MERHTDAPPPSETPPPLDEEAESESDKETEAPEREASPGTLFLRGLAATTLFILLLDFGCRHLWQKRFIDNAAYEFVQRLWVNDDPAGLNVVVVDISKLPRVAPEGHPDVLMTERKALAGLLADIAKRSPAVIGIDTDGSDLDDNPFKPDPVQEPLRQLCLDAQTDSRVPVRLGVYRAGQARIRMAVRCKIRINGRGNLHTHCA